MKDEASEERPSTEQAEGEQTNQPNQENTAEENGENDTNVTVNGEEAVTGEDNAADETKETETTLVEDITVKDPAEEKEAQETDTKEAQETDTKEAQETDTKEAQDTDANRAQDTDANEAQQTDASEAQDTKATEVEDTVTKEADNMTTKEADEINANNTVKANNGVENGTADQVDGKDKTVEQLESRDVIEDLKTEEIEFPRERRLTAYERLSNDLSGDHKVLKEITLGKRIGFYRIRGELGSGNFSQVKMGIHALTKEKVAVKILDKTKLDQKTQRLLSREISSMDHMHHPNIIRLYEVVETLAKLHIVMEYAGGGELFNKISNEGKIAEPEAKIVYAQVLAALQHMHEKNVIHRDLKAENVFYAGPRFVKVGDFGFSTTCRPDQTLNTFCGSPPYAAPELFKDEHYYGSFVDIWAMGILMYFMVCGVMPFRAETVSKLKKCILEGSFVIPTFVSDSCQFLIRGILKPVPHDRFTLAEICRSEWLENQEFPEALPPYNMNPSADGVELSEEELETRAILHDLGIKEDHIKACHGKDSRSSINGTYRIVLHKVQRRRSGRVIDPGEEFEAETNPEDSKNRKNSRKSKKTSKFCVIL